MDARTVLWQIIHLAKLAHLNIESGKISLDKLQVDLNSMIGYIQTVKKFDMLDNTVNYDINNSSSTECTSTKYTEFEPLHEDVLQKPRDPAELLAQAPRAAKPYFHMPPRGNGVEV